LLGAVLNVLVYAVLGALLWATVKYPMLALALLALNLVVLVFLARSGELEEFRANSDAKRIGLLTALGVLVGLALSRVDSVVGGAVAGGAAVAVLSKVADAVSGEKGLKEGSGEKQK